MAAFLRDITIGALCASLVALFQPAWYVTLIAFWAGVFVGMAGSLIVHLWDRVQGKPNQIYTRPLLSGLFYV